jgi:hypothetical protein
VHEESLLLLFEEWWGWKREILSFYCPEATSLEYKHARRVSQTIVFRHREIGGILFAKHRKKIVYGSFLTKIMTEQNVFFQHFLHNLPPISL